MSDGGSKFGQMVDGRLGEEGTVSLSCGRIEKAALHERKTGSV